MFSLQRKILKIRSLYQTMRNTKNAKTWSAPLPSLWGMTADANGHLMLGGCDCREIVDHYGTPLHVMDEALLRSSYVRFSKAFARHGIRCEIYYSYKTNPVPGILKVLHDEGAGAEVISPFELWLALELKVSPDAIIYNGPGKSPEGLRLAIEKGIRRININSFCELDLIEALAAEIGAKPTVGVRLYTGVGWGDQFGFGIESGDAWRVFERLSRTKAVEIDGVHFHLGSQIHTPQLYEAAALVTLKFLAKIKEAFGLRINSFDLGGGFGVPTVRVYEQADQWLQRFLQSPYASPQQSGIPSVEAFAEAIARAIRSGCMKHGLDIPTLVFEPGRIVSSSAQALLARVIEIKSQKAGPDIAVLDTGINIASPVRWEYHEVLAATKITAEHDRLYRLAGPLCTPGDLLSPCKRLPPLQTGDVMAIMDAGAYFSSFENNFSFPKPSIVVVRKGNHSLIRTRETFEDLVQRDRRNNGSMGS